MTRAFITVLGMGDHRSKIHATLLVPLSDESEILFPTFGKDDSHFTHNVVLQPRRRPRDGSWSAIRAWLRSWRMLLGLCWRSAR